MDGSTPSLAWIVAGAVRWYAEGLGCPAAVTAATAAYRSEMDSVGAFFEECCWTGPDFTATARDLYAAYTKWADDAGERPLSQKRLATEMKNRGCDNSERCSYTGRQLWRGVGIRTPDSDANAAAMA